MKTSEPEFVNEKPIDDDIEILRLLYRPYQSSSERIISAYPGEVPYVEVSFYADSHGRDVLTRSKKYQITPEAVRRLSQNGYLEEAYLVPDGTNPYEFELSRKGDQALKDALQEREARSYYGSVRAHIRWRLYEKYPDAFLNEHAREDDLPSYLLWLIDAQVGKLDRSSMRDAMHAARLMGEVLRIAEHDLQIWDHATLQEFLREDVDAGRDLPMAKACPFCTMSHIKEESHGSVE